MLRRKAAEPEVPEGPTYTTDPVSGLPDRSNLDGWLGAAVRTAQADSSRVALSFLELENFHEVSDTYGPEFADEVLATAGRRLADALTPEQQLCRYYGSEFAVITPNVNSVERAIDLTQTLLIVLSEPVVIDAGQVSTKTAAGVALSDSGYDSNATWVHDAHDALTEARLEGHRAVVAHDEATRNRVDVRITPSRVLKGFDHDEFYLMYQPVVRAADNSIAGFEALLRWRDPGASGTFIQPGQFVHLLERLGLMIPLGAWVISEACEQMKHWNALHPDREPMFVSVNLGARQIAHKDFSDTVVNALDKTGLAPELLVLDLTEEALRFNRAGAWNPVRDLKFLGVRAGLDDFGMGEVGMNYLRDLKVDFLTIHRTFMQGLGQVDEDEAIVRSIVDLGRQLDIATVAEGIETHQQNDLVKAIGPVYLQGYYYGRPELPETTEAIITEGPTIEGSEDWRMAYSAMEAPPEEPGEPEAPQPGQSFI